MRSVLLLRMSRRIDGAWPFSGTVTEKDHTWRGAWIQFSLKLLLHRAQHARVPAQYSQSPIGIDFMNHSSGDVLD
jgi:hypothetical protein